MINITDISASSLSIVEAQSTLTQLIIFVLGIVVYSIFIFKFYRFLARKDIFKIDLQKYNKTFSGFVKKLFSVAFYIIKYLIISPLFIFFWFGVIVIILIMLSNKLEVSQILLIAMALVASIRVTAYYNEALSKDLAKMFPFTLLAVFLLDITVFSYYNFIAKLNTIPYLWNQMVYYLAFSVLLEFMLRIFHGISGLLRSKDVKEE
jgi:hypothetical protein